MTRSSPSFTVIGNLGVHDRERLRPILSSTEKRAFRPNKKFCLGERVHVCIAESSLFQAARRFGFNAGWLTIESWNGVNPLTECGGAVEANPKLCERWQGGLSLRFIALRRIITFLTQREGCFKSNQKVVRKNWYEVISTELPLFLQHRQ